ncbi:MAG: UDP-3-O-(3-hydroxymyristoyl)glucosamine N-acyltransferase [candidate division Zixibacteria bacterium]|nr:UDP-3-O-(3-hydroxymyristoyl)glucosamine N-acyltransferase [candidate division Zixibacteria bacterium]
MKITGNKKSFRLARLAEAVGAELDGDGTVIITGAAPVESAGAGHISFVANERYLKYIQTTGASALILKKDVPCQRLPVLRHSDPYLTFARIVDLLYPDAPLVEPGVHPQACVESDVTLDTSSAVGPFCHVRSGTTIGKGCQLVSDVYIGNDCTVGDNCIFYPGVRIMHGSRIGSNVILHSSAVIGSDGFGFAGSETGLKKIKQVGWVEIEDDVEIGSNTSVDRGALGPTRIGRGTKIDNLVQIAHNVEIGRNCIIVAQVGISGSTKIGHGVILAGQVGIIGHLEIGDGVRVAAQSGVSKSVPPGKTIFGYPARDIMETKRIDAALKRLPGLLKRVKKLEDSSGK